MASMKKTNSKKTESDSKTNAVEQPKVTSKEAKKKTFNKDDEILCRSVTVGGLYLEGIKSKEFYSWVEYGDEEYVQYQDLMAMVRNRRNDYIYGPMFIIEDEVFVDENPTLRDFYDEQYSVKDLEGVLDLPVGDMVATIKTLPKRAKESLKSMASTRVMDGRLDSIKKVQALDDIFGTELNLLSKILDS